MNLITILHVDGFGLWKDCLEIDSRGCSLNNFPFLLQAFCLQVYCFVAVL